MGSGGETHRCAYGPCSNSTTVQVCGIWLCRDHSDRLREIVKERRAGQDSPPAGPPDADKGICNEAVFLCRECRHASGAGQYVRVRYTSTGGWNPRWEGRVCEHLEAEEVLSWLRGRKQNG